MNRFVKYLALLLVCASASTSSWAGVASFGFFSSPLPSTQSLVPGQVFAVTLTANTNANNGVTFSTPFILNPNASGQFAIVSGGTCAVGTARLNGETCTVLVQFTGNTPGAFTASLLGQCQFVAAVGGYGINCSTGTQGVLGRFAGNGLALAVDALGPQGLSLILLALLGLGTFYTLRRAS